MKVIVYGSGGLGTMYGWAINAIDVQVIHQLRPYLKHNYLKLPIDMQIRDARPAKYRTVLKHYSPSICSDGTAVSTSSVAVLSVGYQDISMAIKQLKQANFQGIVVVLGKIWDNILVQLNEDFAGHYVLLYPIGSRSVIHQGECHGILSRHLHCDFHIDDDKKKRGIKKLFAHRGFDLHEEENLIQRIKSYCYKDIYKLARKLDASNDGSQQWDQKQLKIELQALKRNSKAMVGQKVGLPLRKMAELQLPIQIGMGKLWTSASHQKSNCPINIAEALALVRRIIKEAEALDGLRFPNVEKLEKYLVGGAGTSHFLVAKRTYFEL